MNCLIKEHKFIIPFPVAHTLPTWSVRGVAHARGMKNIGFATRDLNIALDSAMHLRAIGYTKVKIRSIGNTKYMHKVCIKGLA